MITADPVYAGLLRAVLERPDDDLPRLVLADWLEEHGEPEWGEFIRIQCALASRFVVPDADRCSDESDPAHRRRCKWCRWVRRVSRGTDAFRGRERELWDVGARFGIDTTTFWPIVVRRGFVESVTCDLATFAGGPCEECQVGIVWRRGDRAEECPQCRGTGRTKGIAAALFAVQPVTEVTLTDRAPDPTGIGIYVCWFANRDQDDMPYPADANWLPWCIARHLGPSEPEQYSEFERHTWYFDRDRFAAQTALSAACVAWGRALAGLG